MPSTKHTHPAERTPARMSLIDLSREGTGPPDCGTLHAQFNPTEIEETLSVNWNKLAVLGLSHMPLQYQQTDNHSLSFELTFHAYNTSGYRMDDLALARRFLFSLCYPARDTNWHKSTGAPARVLFVWPQLARLTSVVRKIVFKHTQFNMAGEPVISSAKLTLEEIRDARLYADDVLLRGTQRSTGA